MTNDFIVVIVIVNFFDDCTVIIGLDLNSALDNEDVLVHNAHQVNVDEETDDLNGAPDSEHYRIFSDNEIVNKHHDEREQASDDLFEQSPF